MPKEDTTRTRNSAASREHHAAGTVDAAEQDGGRALLTSAVLIGLGALIEPELLAGMAIGAGIVLVSKWLPNIVGGAIRPIVKTAIKAGYTAVATATEIAAEAAEEVQDIAAEARAERESEHGGEQTRQ
jgi:Protein of unknown function (DUF5132)